MAAAWAAWAAGAVGGLLVTYSDSLLLSTAKNMALSSRSRRLCAVESMAVPRCAILSSCMHAFHGGMDRRRLHLQKACFGERRCHAHSQLYDRALPVTYSRKLSAIRVKYAIRKAGARISALRSLHWAASNCVADTRRMKVACWTG